MSDRTKLLISLGYAESMLSEIPYPVDRDPDPMDPSPKDLIGWTLGMVLKDIRETLADASHKETA